MLPKDPNILFSYINLKLRDNYPSLNALCDDLDVDEKEVINSLKQIGYYYNEEDNQFQPVI